jgi:hypothetical protein
MRRACLASFAVLLAAPAFAQPVTPAPATPRAHHGRHNATPPAASGAPAAAAPTHGNTYLPPSDVQPTTTHQEGDYGGVTPGETPKVDHPRPKRKPPKGTLSWVGFEAKDGGAELFFQSIAPFDVTQEVVNGGLVVHLSGLHALGANAGRAIDTRFFDNPLASIAAKHGSGKNGNGIDVRIAFKNAKDAQQGTLKTNTEADGYYYAYLSFPEGADQKAPDSTLAEPDK